MTEGQRGSCRGISTYNNPTSQSAVILKNKKTQNQLNSPYMVKISTLPAVCERQKFYRHLY